MELLRGLGPKGAAIYVGDAAATGQGTTRRTSQGFGQSADMA